MKHVHYFKVIALNEESAVERVQEELEHPDTVKPPFVEYFEVDESGVTTDQGGVFKSLYFQYLLLIKPTNEGHLEACNRQRLIALAKMLMALYPGGEIRDIEDGMAEREYSLPGITVMDDGEDDGECFYVPVIIFDTFNTFSHEPCKPA